MKKTYITPAFLAVALNMKNCAMLSASDGSGNSVLPDGGEGDGTDLGVKGLTGKNLWDEEW